jgi:DNA helicase-4
MDPQLTINLKDRVIKSLCSSSNRRFAREVAIELSCDRDEVFHILENERKKGTVLTDGYQWWIDDTLAKEAFFRAIKHLENNEWVKADEIALSTDLTQELENQLLVRKGQLVEIIMSGVLSVDSDQGRIIGNPSKTIRVTARAGSGKTRLLRALTYFHIDQYGYAPEEILLLAFNRDAAEQIERGLIELLGLPTFPGARTFHSLSYGIAQPEQAIVFDKGREIGAMQLTELVQNVLRNQIDAPLLDEIYSMFRYETETDKLTGALLQGDAHYDFRRELDQVTLKGYSVKSAGEKYIGDFLFEHGLDHYYEDPIYWEKGLYRPDFKIKTANKEYIIIEHWAVNPDAEHIFGSRDWSEAKLRNYQENARRKREFWASKGIPLVETCADQCGDRVAFEAMLAERLRPHLGALQRLSHEELLSRVEVIHISRLAAWVAQAIQRSQKRGWDAENLAQMLATHIPNSERERLFLRLVQQVFAAYGPELERQGKTDFDRLFNRSNALMRAEPPRTVLAGKQTSIDLRKLRICLVDEAQDLSPQFIEALVLLRAMNPTLRLVFVGDDWQAINRFAGSEVELFNRNIMERFGNCTTATLKTNYRSSQQIVASGNALMEHDGIPAIAFDHTPGRIQMADYDTVWVEGRKDQPGFEDDEPFRAYRGGTGSLLKTLYQLAVPDLVAGKSVGVLFRTNQFFGREIRDLEKSFFRIIDHFRWPHDDVKMWKETKRIVFSTTHKFKGLECDTVFIIAPHFGNFPLLNASSIELFRFFGDTLERAVEDEQRLFYVAITRAKERLVFLAESKRDDASPFLEPFRSKITRISVPGNPNRPPGLRDFENPAI